jgi:hypothetical protein
MSSISQGRVGTLFDAMAEDVTWRWMGVSQWSRTFEGKQLVQDKLFGGARETLSASSSGAASVAISSTRESPGPSLVAEPSQPDYSEWVHRPDGQCRCGR